MKTAFKKALALFLSFIYILTLSPTLIFAEGEAPILSDSFENDGSDELWVGGIRDNSLSYEGDWGCQVINPFGDPDTGVFGHILEYSDIIHLEEGKFYTFSAYVMNPWADDLSTPTATAYLGRDNTALFIDISLVGFDWSYVSASFMATEDTYCSPIITLDGGDESIGFFIDSITVTEEKRVPRYTTLEGPDSLYIPDMGYADYRYSIVTYDDTDTPINVLLDDFNFSLDNIPEGVEFDSKTGILRVHSTALENENLTLTCSVSVGFPLLDSSKSISTTKNILLDPGFDSGEEYWVSDYPMEYIDGEISLFASESGNWGKYTSITYTRQLFLLEGKMYVFRADVKSDSEFPASGVYISNLSFASSGYAEINITGIGGEQSRVTSAFLIEDTGLYDLTINLYAPSERPIYIDNVYLGAEDAAPSAISIRAPGNIFVPSTVTVLPCYGSVLDQLGNVMEEHTPTVTISPCGKGVYLSNGEIIVEKGADCGDYLITAEYQGITSTHTISVSNDAIGDGSFEEKQANEWWTASDGSIFSIVDYNGTLAGHVYSPDTSCIVINNSYMELVENEYYVYSAAPGFGEGVITAFIADAYTGEYVPFAQYDPELGACIAFSLDKTVTGRLVLYIESEESIGMIFDDISITPAELSVSDIIVTGGEYGDFLRGSYTYINNMTSSYDADISTTRWYISSTPDGHYEPIGIPNQNYLEFTADMAGQYIVFEVTPICADTGLVGESVRSLPVHVASEIESIPDDRPLSEMTPIELDNIKTHPFIDITGHWSEDMIASLTASGIISGKTKTKFYPEHFVTRAEFTAMVVRAFSLVSLPYSGQFDDVSASDWHSGFIEAAYRRGIIEGIDENTFGPDEYITREQMATIIFRAYQLAEGLMPYDLPLRYYDNFMISPWAYDSVKNCTNLNLFTGVESNLFKPKDHATRAQAAAVIYRTLKCF